MKQKHIWLPYGASKKMCENLKIPRTTLYAALHYHSDSIQAKAVRRDALKYYGGRIIE